MEAIDKIKSWASALADVGVSLIALGIVLEVLFTLSQAFQVKDL